MKRWPLHKAYFWETAPFFRILLPVVAGILIYSPAASLLCQLYLAVILISFIALCVFEVLKKRSSFFRYTGFLLLNIIFLLGSWTICWFNDVRNDAKWFGNAEKNKGDHFFVARIDAAPQEKDKTWKLPLQVLSTREGNETRIVNGKAFIYVYKNEHPFPFNFGDTIIIPDRWREIHNQGNPFEFNYAQYCARNNLFYQQFLPVNKISLYSRGSGKQKSALEKSHDWCMQQLERYLPEVGTKGLIQAMLLGDESNLDNETRSSYSETGIVHIIAISGGNVAIFFIVISYLLWWVRNKKYAWIKYLAALPLVWLYVLMAGAAPSAIRAAMMFSILAIGFVMQKTPNSLNQLFATAVILLLAEPMWLFAVGFQLSFIAVLSLILFYKPIYQILSPTNKIFKALWGTICASLAAEILVAPLVVYYFHLFPLLFIVANVAAFVFMSVALVLAIAIIALSFIPVLSKILGTITIWLVIHFNQGIQYLQHLNPRSFHFLRLSGPELLLLYMFIGGLATFVLKKIKPALFSGMIAICLLLFLFCFDEWNALHQRRLLVYNINKASQVELIEGKYFSVLHTDSVIDNKKKEYSLKPAHTMWMAWKENAARQGEIFVIGDKKALILNTPIETSDSFPVDYLIITCPVKGLDPAQLLQIFKPKTLVLGNNNGRRTVAKWYTNCYEKNISMPALSYSGAFVLQ